MYTAISILLVAINAYICGVTTDLIIGGRNKQND